MRTLLFIAIRLTISLMLTACVLAAVVVAVPEVGADRRLGGVVLVALTAGFFLFLSWVWPANRR
jgi:hypothetical protein